MQFHKIRHPDNFRFAPAVPIQARVRDLGSDVFHLELSDPARWSLDARTLPLLEEGFGSTASSHRLQMTEQGALVLSGADGATVLAGRAGASVGVCGSAWMLQFAREACMRFFGQGEKVTGLEKSGKRSNFWNADVWADHAIHTVEHGQADPQYASIPYLLVRNGAHWIGLLVDNPGAVFMDTGSNWFFFGKDDQDAPPSFWLGAPHGVPALYLIAGTSVQSVTERLQRLVGTTPLPPVWALGHHQSRWGYAGMQQLSRLDQAFTEHAFPNDGLWLDIDYMQDYKVFTTNPAHFENLTEDLRSLQAQGRRIVPILDPGVKVQPGFAVAESGQAVDIFCRNPEGQPYVGFVWPGRTWFPDFSLPEARDWWASYAKAFRTSGFDGAWLDMNDPSTGAADLEDMRFQRGAWPHWAYHNQYALGMAQATRVGFLAARPDERPFLLTRSASTGMSRFAAVWTGDNFSNWHHLRTAIHCSLNLALSGVPFNGPDVPGFGGHADKDLALAWYKAGCLFPFLRNHACAGTADQEPWAFGTEALDTIRHHVRLRYKLLPYMVQLWAAQEAQGAAVMRPLFYDFADTDGLDLDRVDDQFLIGPAILQAPVVQPGTQQRAVVLPGPCRWLEAATGRFVAGGRMVHASSSAQATPIYLREGSLIPMQAGWPQKPGVDLAHIELHAILGPDCAGVAVLDYVADDGITLAYQRGVRSHWQFEAHRNAATLVVTVRTMARGHQPLQLRVVGYGGIQTVRLVVDGAAATDYPAVAAPWTLSGAELNASAMVACVSL
ncbi:MAG: glycoside hydrolase family 31 protein [Rhodoferax sp.]